ncbi:MAG: Uncharacterized protein FD161_2507 [Limisphaerales bacterium]|nr:MAG: Uncharacterized protein FD161_2507 [Limisphaerales bacterium]KAG0508627.1 MAG: Uncharacterized protein E1N63_2258 [Limisphaerales bacterium]TXT48068.1 MAG: Uncharacterized protein FD140_3818 [Limisphaerales bacterium]
MGTFLAFYIHRGEKDAAVMEAVRTLYPKVVFEQVPNFIAAALSGDDFPLPEQKLADLSVASATDVIGLAYQGAAGSFMFHHWRGGVQLRCLWYGCEEEGCWDRVEGQAEPWEQAYFWSPEALKNALLYEEDQGRRQQMERFWKDATLVKGETMPSICAEDTVHAVMEHYRLFGEEPVAPQDNPPSAVAPPVEAAAKPKSFWSRLFGQ